MKSLLWSALAALILVLTMGAAACGASSAGSSFIYPADGGGVPPSDATVPVIVPPSLLEGGHCPTARSPSPSRRPRPASWSPSARPPSIPTQQFVATYGGVTVGAAFTIDRGEIGSIGVATGLFTPAGTLGGTANVTATYNGLTATATVNVKITNISIGDPNAPDAGAGDAGDGGDAGSAGGAGGFGGVGGAGEGPPATPGQVATLNGPPTADATIGFLYPYDKTVFPQAILPPLLQWTYGAHSFSAVRIHITENSYEYKGYFQQPSAPFQNAPIPQAVWNAVAYSNTGETVQVELVFAEGTTAVGPITETWKFAQGELKGTIYYNSYGTKLAFNFSGALGPNPNFGGATLAIHENATDPVLVAGNTTANPSNDHTGCRVCHSVSSGGATLMTQHGDSYGTTSSYALTSNNTETVLPTNNGNGRFTYPALTPDGTKMLTSESALYNIDGSLVTGVTGMPSGLSAFLPAFSPDGTLVAFNFAAGSGVDGGPGADQASIASVDFNPTTLAFSNLQTLATPATGTHAYWPSFLPTSTGIVFDVETVYNGRDTAGTRSQCDQGGPVACQNEGTHAELWWVDVKTKQATRLDQLNGKGYVPPHPSYTGTAGDDSTLNYEPTVNPVPSGGYAWVVFTSRRLYGNVATINPFWSDPRYEDISVTPTTKKLWVAAIDLNAAPGTDPSHPAFYLPAQEILAGNARGFWVVDPCQIDGTSCVTGDECCGGYCRPGEDGGGLTCSATQPSCSQEYEKCTTTADCCGASLGITCINGRCATNAPRRSEGRTRRALESGGHGERRWTVQGAPGWGPARTGGGRASGSAAPARTPRRAGRAGTPPSTAGAAPAHRGSARRARRASRRARRGSRPARSVARPRRRAGSPRGASGSTPPTPRA